MKRAFKNRRSGRRWGWKWRTPLNMGMAAVVAMGCWMVGNAAHASANESVTMVTGSQTAGDGAVLRVMAVGGSSAHGWADPHNFSYLKRAFQGLADRTRSQLMYADHTIPGAPAASVSSGRFAMWLAEDRPQVVAISWGLLDDAHNHTPMATFERTIRDEITQSLDAHALVFVVTPPAVTVTIGPLLAPFEKFALGEYSVVEGLNSPDVYWFDLHAQTMDWIQGHNQTMTAYCAGSWHPNGAGQALGGQVLLSDLHQAFGGRFKTLRALETGTRSL